MILQNKPFEMSLPLPGFEPTLHRNIGQSLLTYWNNNKICMRTPCLHVHNLTFITISFITSLFGFAMRYLYICFRVLWLCWCMIKYYKIWLQQQNTLEKIRTMCVRFFNRNFNQIIINLIQLMIFHIIFNANLFS